MAIGRLRPATRSQCVHQANGLPLPRYRKSPEAKHYTIPAINSLRSIKGMQLPGIQLVVTGAHPIPIVFHHHPHIHGDVSPVGIGGDGVQLTIFFGQQQDIVEKLCLCLAVGFQLCRPIIVVGVEKPVFDLHFVSFRHCYRRLSIR